MCLGGTRKKAESAYEYKFDAYDHAITDWFLEPYDWHIEKSWLANSSGMWAMFSLCLRTYAAGMGR